MTSEKKPTGWLVIRRRLNAQSKTSLLALVKDLYDASSSNRDFLHARAQAEVGDGTAVERYRHTIIEQFYPSRGFGKLKLAEARKAIRDYRRATGNPARINHERFCCNFGFPAVTSLRRAGSPLTPSTYCSSTPQGLAAPHARLARDCAISRRTVMINAG
jgi:hypothetical protein